jgi:hypothetical protein
MGRGVARHKPYNLEQDKWIPLSYADQIVPGSFEYALNEIVEERLDLELFTLVPDIEKVTHAPAA